MGISGTRAKMVHPARIAEEASVEVSLSVSRFVLCYLNTVAGKL